MSKREKLKQFFGLLARAARRSKLAVVCLFLLGALLFAGVRANGQFGLDPCCAIISAGLQSISGLLKSVVAKPLAEIQTVEQQAAIFEQQVVYPATAISNARNLVSQVQGDVRQLVLTSRIPLNSATLPAPRQLEQLLLSHNPQSTAQVSQSYSALYGAVMAATDAAQPVRDMVDATDAEAQAALKRAILLDAEADIELAVADKINEQIQNAAPGSAPILEAQAAAWNVRANAYTQSAMAELMRVRSIDLANSSATIKLSATSNSILRNTTDHVLGRTR